MIDAVDIHSFTALICIYAQESLSHVMMNAMDVPDLNLINVLAVMMELFFLIMNVYLPVQKGIMVTKWLMLVSFVIKLVKLVLDLLMINVTHVMNKLIFSFLVFLRVLRILRKLNVVIKVVLSWLDVVVLDSMNATNVLITYIVMAIVVS